MTFPDIISSMFFDWFRCFHLFLFDLCDRLSSFNQFSNCTLNLGTFLSSFPLLQTLYGFYWKFNSLRSGIRILEIG